MLGCGNEAEQQGKMVGKAIDGPTFKTRAKKQKQTLMRPLPDTT